MHIARSILIVCAITIGSFIAGSVCYAGTVTNIDNSGPGSLRQAILDASPGETIDFDSKLNGLSIGITGSGLILNKPLTITAAALPSGITINGSGGSYSVIRETVGPLRLDHLTITGANGGFGVYGGAINSVTGAALYIDNCQFIGNHAYGDGALSTHGFLDMRNSLVSGNTSGNQGVGGVDVVGRYPGSVIDNCIITGNTGGDGGLNASGNANFTVMNSQINGNFVNPPYAGTGGGFYAGATIVFDNCTINDNATGGIRATTYQSTRSSITLRNGSEVSNNETFGIQLTTPNTGIHSALTIRNSCTISNNGTNGILAFYGNLTIDADSADNGCTISGNRGAQFAVKITNVSNATTLNYVTIDDNSGVGIDHNGFQLNLNDCNITNNQKGGINNIGQILPAAIIRCNRCKIIGNNPSALPGSPGGIMSTNGDVVLDHSTVADNRAVTGAGIYNLSINAIPSSTLTVRRSVVYGNESTDGSGGGISAFNSGGGGVFTTLDNSTVFGNTTNNGKGGGIYFNPGSSESSLTMIASTITQNQAMGSGANGKGGGVFAELNANGTARSKSTIIGLNNDAQGNPDVYGSFDSDDNNLISIVDGSSGFVGVNDQTGSIDFPLDPGLDPSLSDNGGQTLTDAILAGSPAIDAGAPDLAGTLDQTDYKRGSNPTVGAYEYRAGRGPSGNKRLHGRIHIP